MKIKGKTEWLLTLNLFLLICMAGSVSAATSYTTTVTCIMPDLIGTSNEAVTTDQEKTLQNTIALTEKELKQDQQELVTSERQGDEIIMTVCAK